MKFLLLVLSLRSVLYRLSRSGQKNKPGRRERDDAPSEHNVWW